MPSFKAITTKESEAFRAGAPDAHGNPAERAVSPGEGTPCRHCLKHIPKGQDMLILAYKPFDGSHPYAETGPIFLCADSCERGGGDDLPEIFTTSPDFLVKGYSANDRIIYGTGAVTPTKEMQSRIDAIFADPEVAYIHVRSARNNCYQARVDRD
ncbi:MAG: DUF1203 domain-containing protein [Pseudomonadota bacterium]